MKKMVLFFGVLLCLPAYSAQQWCTGKLRDVWVDANGNVYINSSWSGNHVQICSLTAIWKTVSVDVCKSWLSIAMSAQVSQSNTTTYYADLPACNQIPYYNLAPNPGYLMLTQ